MRLQTSGMCAVYLLRYKENLHTGKAPSTYRSLPRHKFSKSHMYEDSQWRGPLRTKWSSANGAKGLSAINLYACSYTCVGKLSAKLNLDVDILFVNKSCSAHADSKNTSADPFTHSQISVCIYTILYTRGWFDWARHKSKIFLKKIFSSTFCVYYLSNTYI